MEDWREQDNPFGTATYFQTVPQGFIHSEGYCHFSFGDNERHDLGGRVSLPTIHFLKVNPKYPIQVRESGKISILPEGDKRMPAQIWEDEQAYDTVGFAMVPYNVSVEDVGGWEVLNVFENGLERPNGSKTPLSILYAKSGLGIDSQGIHAWGKITPPQIIRRLFDWLYLKKEFSYIDEKNRWERDPWIHAGRTCLTFAEKGDFVRKTGLLLEKRFDERLFVERPRED